MKYARIENSKRLLLRSFIRGAIGGTLAGCWEWMGAKNSGGYGHINGPRGDVLVHRFSYEFFVGPIQPGLTIDHLCRNRSCFNPRHLEPVPQAVNTARGDGMSSRYAARTHCPAGHEFNERNTRRDYRGHRKCRTCDALRHRASRYNTKNRRLAEAFLAEDAKQ